MCLKSNSLLSLITTGLLVMMMVLDVVKADDDGGGMTLDDMITTLESFASSCDPAPERKHIEEVVLSVRDAQRETKCFRYCLMQQFDLAEEGGTKMDREKAKDMMMMAVPDNEDVVLEIIDKCNEKNAAITDNCEAAHAHAMCILDECKERGIDLPEVKQ